MTLMQLLDVNEAMNQVQHHRGELNRSGHLQRIIIADDNPEILQITRDMLQPYFEVLAAVSDGDSALREASQGNPDVMVLDISMGNVSGIEVARRLQESSCHIKIIFLTVHEDPEFIRSALSAGGAAYVFKSRIDTDLIPAIESACSGKLFVSRRGTMHSTLAE